MIMPATEFPLCRRAQRLFFIGILALALLQTPLVSIGQTSEFKTVELWPEGAPGAVGQEDIDKPSLTLLLPAKGQSNGAAVVICPGGAYRMLVMDHEGVQVAQWLNTQGVAGFVLKYRVGPRYRHPAPLQDVQRALRYVREHAAEFGIVPSRVGVMGFSAGGHLASTAATHFDAGDPTAPDPVERWSSRPDFAVLCYGLMALRDANGPSSAGMLLGDDPDPALVESLTSQKQVTPQTPPTFLFHTAEDIRVPPDNSVLFYQACRAAGVPAELHIFGYGVHGLGLAVGDPVNARWTDLFAGWLRKSGFLTDVERMAVSGLVTVDGKPLPRGWITFVPVNSETKPIASAYIGNTGRFQIDAKMGPCIGPHRVEIRQVANAALQVPSIEGVKLFTRESPQGEPILFEVQLGMNHLDVALQTGQ